MNNICPTRRLRALKEHLERSRDYADRAGERVRACALSEAVTALSIELAIFEINFGETVELTEVIREHN